MLVILLITKGALQSLECLSAGGAVHVQGDIIPVEGLILEDVTPGLYTVHCLPIKLVASDGAPARCILMT